MAGSNTEHTRELITRLFKEYENGALRQIMNAVADDVHWVLAGTNQLSGEYRSKSEFSDAIRDRMNPKLREPIRPSVRRITVDNDVAVVEFHGRATSISGRPYENDYCWILRVADDQIVEVTAYLDGAMLDDLLQATES
jgi:ketosteroid isomerase-like protein